MVVGLKIKSEPSAAGPILRGGATERESIAACGDASLAKSAPTTFHVKHIFSPHEHVYIRHGQALMQREVHGVARQPCHVPDPLVYIPGRDDHIAG